MACRNKAQPRSNFCHVHAPPPEPLQPVSDYRELDTLLRSPRPRVIDPIELLRQPADDLPEDPEWRVNGATIGRYFGNGHGALPAEQKMLCVIVAAEMLPPLGKGELQVQQNLELLRDWLQGLPATIPAPDTRNRQQRHACVEWLMRTVNGDRGELWGADSMIAGVMELLADAPESRSPYFTPLGSARAALRPLFTRWWSRCRARLAFADAWTARLDVAWPTMEMVPAGASEEMRDLVRRVRNHSLGDPWEVVGGDLSGHLAEIPQYRAGHPLRGLRLSAVAQRTDYHDILFVVDGSPVRLAVTPRQWSQSPSVNWFDSFDEWLELEYPDDDDAGSP